MPKQTSFPEWLTQQMHRDDPVGDLARDAARDPRNPKFTTLEGWQVHIESASMEPVYALGCLGTAWNEWTAAQQGPPICPKCGQPAILQTGAEAYPHRPDLAHIYRWRCIPCKTSVGCHPGGIQPLGTLADAETQAARIQAHAAFDPLWKMRGGSRKKAYRWLAKELGATEVHMGSMDIAMCKRVVEVCGFALRQLQAQDNPGSPLGRRVRTF